MENLQEKTKEYKMELKFIEIAASGRGNTKVKGLRFRSTKKGIISAIIGSEVASELLKLNYKKARIATNGSDKYIVFSFSVGYFKFSTQGQTMRCDAQSIIKQILPEINVLLNYGDAIECELIKNHGYNGNVSVFKLGNFKKIEQI